MRHSPSPFARALIRHPWRRLEQALQGGLHGGGAAVEDEVGAPIEPSHVLLRHARCHECRDQDTPDSCVFEAVPVAPALQVRGPRWKRRPPTAHTRITSSRCCMWFERPGIQSVTPSPRPRTPGWCAFEGCSRVRFRTGGSTALPPSSDDGSTGAAERTVTPRRTLDRRRRRAPAPAHPMLT